MKNKLLVLATLLLNTTSLLHGMKHETDELNNIQLNLALIKEVFTKSPRPNETRVSMWDAQSISTQPTIQEPLIISTTGLIGCVATTLHVTYNNGDQYAGITHYPPTSDEHNNAVEKLCLQALNNQNESKKIVATHFFFSAPDNNESMVYELLTAQEKEATPIYQLLSNTVHTTLKETGIIKTHLIPYEISDTANLVNLFLDNAVQERDIEMILYPDKATLRVKDQTIDVNEGYSHEK